MSFFRQLGRGFNRFFGRQLPQGAAKFGRQLSTTSSKVGNALGKASNFVSKLERAGVPVVSDFAGIANRGLGVARNVADIGTASGQGLTALGNRDWKGALNAGKTILSEGRDVAGEVSKVAPMFI